MTIYQTIWDEDQAGSGIRPVLKASAGDSQHGYVVVNEQPVRDQKLNLFTEVVIPEHKQASYQLCKKLFNNYTLSQSKTEWQSPEEDAEIHALLEHIVDSRPMIAARNFLSQQTGETYTISHWYKVLLDVWFTQFTQSSGKDLSAFEHVIVGEQSRSKVSGYHFWYKYHLDDSFKLLDSDDIQYLGLRGKNETENVLVPEISTISFKWEAFDYENNAYRPLYKKIGGFFNGCSVEGLMALGTVRFLSASRSPKEGEINGALYNFKVFRSQNGKHMRTFYPEFIHITDTQSNTDNAGPVEVIISDPNEPPTKNTEEDSIKIISALVNPEGNDSGLEKITLFNLTPVPFDLDGWQLLDKNKNTRRLKGVIEPGETLVVRLDASQIQLSNKGGKIELVNNSGVIIDAVAYTKTQVNRQGWSIIF